jgi:hypothetical protein
VKEEDYQKLFEFGKKYLLDTDGVTKAMLDNHLYPDKLTTIEDVFKGLLDSLKNRSHMPNTIGELDKLKNFDKVTYGYNSKQVMKNYDDWRDLFKQIKAECNPKSEMNIDKEDSYWVIFCKGTMDAAKFLSHFSDFVEFDKFVWRFYETEFTHPALAWLIGKEVYGLGFALACDFLKECGYTRYAKPDKHLKDIFNGLGICDSKDDYVVYKAIINFANVIGQEPYVVDKVFWLIGSGNFYLDDVKVKTDKWDFIENAKRLFNVD